MHKSKHYVNKTSPNLETKQQQQKTHTKKKIRFSIMKYQKKREERMNIRTERDKKQ